jgi:SulP family sulfate permease
VLAGLLGSLLVLPQGIAFATLAGLPPQHGLYSAIIPCVVAALFGSSRHVMSGPTNANSLALFAMLTPLAAAGSALYIELALAITVMVGIMQLMIGALRLGTLANFISPTVLLGFTAGAALLIAIYALRDLLGLPGAGNHGAVAVLGQIASQFSQSQPGAVLVGLVTVATALGTRLADQRMPALLAALCAGTSVAAVLNMHRSAWDIAPVITVGTISAVWPPLHMPELAWSSVTGLLEPAVALTIIASSQSISIAKAVALRSGQHIDTNREFVGQGLSNVIGGFFSAYLSCGSLNRSMPNLHAGARTPLAAVFSSLLLVVLVVMMSPLLALIPMAAIAGLLILVAWDLLHLRRWRYLLNHSRGDFGVALATFAATVTISMELAILLGTVASLGSYLSRTSRPAMRSMGFDSMSHARRFVVIDDNPAALSECRHLKLLRMEGSLYFGATQHAADRLNALRSVPDGPKHLLVMAKSMNYIDLAGAELWQAEMETRRSMGGDLYFHRPRPQVIRLWEQIGFLDALGRDHIFSDKQSAISTILSRVGSNPCTDCGSRTFWECQPTATGRGG